MTEQEFDGEAILAKAAEAAFAEKIVAVDEEAASFLIFRVAEHLFAFPGGQTREIIPGGGIIWVPGASELLPGVVNVRGDVVAVIDARKLLSLGGEACGGFFVLLRQGDGRSAVLVDEIVDVLDLPASEQQAPLTSLSEELRRLAVSAFSYGEKIVTVLDVGLLLETVTA